MVAIHLIVKNGEKYIKKCLEAALNQDYSNYELWVFDNSSQDKTREIIEKDFWGVKLVKWDRNYGLGGGFNRSLGYTNSKYVVLLCVDVILALNFLSEAAKVLENNPKIGALQPKVLRWDSNTLSDTIDTTGFEIFKSRRLINRGHGEKDIGQYQEGEIFSYEGACPVFRRQTLLDTKNKSGEILDEDFKWYADDSDLGWRMRLLNWKSYYTPNVVAYHDRQTTKTLRKNLFDFIQIRKKIPWQKRMLDWRNQRLSMVKNEFLSIFLKNMPYFLKREVPLLIYFLFFEPRTLFLGVFGFLKLLPKMLKKRKVIMANRNIDSKEIQKWFL